MRRSKLNLWGKLIGTFNDFTINNKPKSITVHIEFENYFDVKGTSL